jgi:hypothetical protein
VFGAEVLRDGARVRKVALMEKQYSHYFITDEITLLEQGGQKQQKDQLQQLII